MSRRNVSVDHEMLIQCIIIRQSLATKAESTRYDLSLGFCVIPIQHIYYDFQIAEAIAVSSSLRLWMDVFALPEKSNMAVTESDLDSKVRKMSITF